VKAVALATAALAAALSIAPATAAGDTTAPTVSVTRPTSGETVSGSVRLNVSASDNVGVTRVEYFVDGTRVATDGSGPDFSDSWNSDAVADGAHSLVATARDSAGNTGRSAALSFSVRNGSAPLPPPPPPPPADPGDSSPPTVTVVAPSDQSVIRGTVQLDVLASDNVGVTRVDYYLDGAQVASDASAPAWDEPWDSTAAADGSHTLVARARDAAGNVGSSAAVRLTVDNVPDSTPTPPTPPPSGACVRPYADSGPWNTPIGPSPTVHANSSTYVASMTPTLTSDPKQYTYPVYYADSSTAFRTVTISGRFSNVTTETTIRNQSGGTVSVPVPAAAASAAGSDAQLIILNRQTGDEWGFWRLYKDSAGRWSATNGYHYNTGWSGVPPRGFVSRGPGVPYLAGLVRPCEIARGSIDHALAFAYDYPTPEWIWPATKSDGKGPVATNLPEGARLQLDPSLTTAQLQTLGITGPALVIAQALQRYGMYVIDNSGREKVMMEYDGTAGWNGTITASTVSKIPLSKFRWVDRS
jgi:hypothetical protein